MRPVHAFYPAFVFAVIFRQLLCYLKRTAGNIAADCRFGFDEADQACICEMAWGSQGYSPIASGVFAARKGEPRRHCTRRGLRDQREIRSRLIDSAVRDERTRRRRLHSNVVDLFHLRRFVPGICLIHAVGEDDKALGGSPVKRRR